MAHEDIISLWTFFLQDVKQCIEFERLNVDEPNTLHKTICQACSSAVRDSLANLLAELAYFEAALVCNTPATTAPIIKINLQKSFVRKLQNVITSLHKQLTTNCFLKDDIQNLFLILNETIQLEQLESNNGTLETFIYLMVASLVPILNSYALSSKGKKPSDDAEGLKTILQLQSRTYCKNPNNPLILLNTIIDALTTIEKSYNISIKMCKCHEDPDNEFEALSTCVRLVATELQGNLTFTNPFMPVDEEKKKTSLDRNIKDKLFHTTSSNAFLQSAVSSLRSDIQHKTEANPESGVKENILRKSNFLLPNHIEQTIKTELTKSTARACKLTLSKLFSDYSFMDHIRGLRNILFMQDGTVMEQFTNEIVCKVGAATKWNQESWLTLSLHNCMSNGRLAWFSNFLSVELGCSALLNTTSALPKLTINYAAPWPVSEIIHRDSLQLYNKVFSFLLKIKFNLATLQRLSYKDLGSSTADIHNRMFWLRNWMMYFLSNVYTYLMQCVLEPLYVEFDLKAFNCNDMEHLTLLHQEYIQNIYRGGFLDQGSEFINQPIQEIADFTEEIVASWNGTSSDSVIHEMEKKFIFRYSYVISMLNSAACRSIFQNVGSLASSLSHKHPTSFGKH